MIEITHLRQAHKKDSMDYIRKKRNFEVELEEIKKRASDKSWMFTSKVRSLEVELNAAREKIQLLKGSSSWSSNNVQYGWDWSKFSDL